MLSDTASPLPNHGMDHTLTLTVPPLACLFLGQLGIIGAIGIDLGQLHLHGLFRHLQK